MKASLLILGVLHRGDFHPYEIKRRLENAMVECYTDVDTGTLYYAIKQLEKDGLIAAVTQERVARGGVRTVYTITSKGRAEFQMMLHAQWAEEGPVMQTLYGPLLFLHLANPQKVAAILCARIARLDDLIAKLGPIRKLMAPIAATGSMHLLGHIDKQRRLDRQWTRDLLADIEAEGVRDIADPKLLAAGGAQMRKEQPSRVPRKRNKA